MPIIKKIYLNGVEFSNPDSTKEYRPIQPPDSNRLWRYMNFVTGNCKFPISDN